MDRVADSSVALVTGGGTGIGLACATGLARRGARTVIAGRRIHVLNGAVRRIREELPEASIDAVVCDLGVRDEPEALVRAVAARAGPLDVLVNAAATCSPFPTLDLTAEVWDDTVNVALRGAALCSIAAARQMRERGGRIVMVTSIDEQLAEPNVAHYAAAKAGLGAFARSLAIDLGDRGIVVNCVAPGWVRTPTAQARLDHATPDSLKRLNALARPASPDEIANVVVYLALDAPEYLTGSTITVDGGQSAKAAMP